MFAPGDTRRIMRQFGIQADKHLGQNFLIEQAALDKILKAADLKASDTVLEVGAGLGVLTCALAETAGHVVAVEFDRRLLPPLEWATQSFQNVRLIHADILSLELEDILPAGGYKVVANIPYNITSLPHPKDIRGCASGRAGCPHDPAGGRPTNCRIAGRDERPRTQRPVVRNLGDLCSHSCWVLLSPAKGRFGGHPHPDGGIPGNPS